MEKIETTCVLFVLVGNDAHKFLCLAFVIKQCLAGSVKQIQLNLDIFIRYGDELYFEVHPDCLHWRIGLPTFKVEHEDMITLVWALNHKVVLRIIRAASFEHLYQSSFPDSSVTWSNPDAIVIKMSIKWTE